MAFAGYAPDECIKLNGVRLAAGRSPENRGAQSNGWKSNAQRRVVDG